MAVIWISLALMTAAALAFVLVPLLRRPPLSADELAARKESNRQVFRQRLAELEEERQLQQWSDEETERLSTELKRGFLQDMADLEAMEEGVQRRRESAPVRFIPYVVLVTLPLVAWFFYDRYGSAHDLPAPELMAAVSSAENAEQQEAALVSLAEFLQRRFERNPADVQGGYMLGSLYLNLENFPAAIDTFRRIVDAVDQDRDRATILGQLAQAQYLAADQNMTPEVEATIGQTLALNPNEQAVMSLLAIEALMAGEVEDAMSYWRRQLNQLQPGSREARTLQQRINQVQSLLVELDAQESSTGERAPEQEPQATQVQVVVDVDIAPEIRAQVDDTMRVFVFARSTQMPMPLAAQTFTVAELPQRLVLDDSMAMMENLRLSSAETVIVGARVSLSGEATAQSGDFQALSGALVLREQGDSPVSLVISEQVP